MRIQKLGAPRWLYLPVWVAIAGIGSAPLTWPGALHAEALSPEQAATRDEAGVSPAQPGTEPGRVFFIVHLAVV